MRTWVVNALVVALILVVGAYARSTDQETERLAVETHSALCAFKGDLAERQRNARKYVADVRSGDREAIAGITLAEIQQSISTRQDTLDALASLDCT